MANIFTNFFAQFQSAPQSDVNLDVASMDVTRIENEEGASDKTMTLQVSIGLREISLQVKPGTTYKELVELAKQQVPGLQSTSIAVLDMDSNQVQQNMAAPVTGKNYSLESTSGNAG